MDNQELLQLRHTWDDEEEGTTAAVEPLQNKKNRPTFYQFQHNWLEEFRIRRRFAALSEDTLLASCPVPLLVKGIERSIKYRFTESAVALYFYLYETPSIYPHLSIQLEPTWIEFEALLKGQAGDPYGESGLYVTQMPLYEVAQQNHDLTPMMQEFARRYAGYWYVATHALLGEDGSHLDKTPTITSVLYQPERDDYHLLLPPWHHCLWEQCEYLNPNDASTVAIIPCFRCSDLMGSVIRALTLMLSMTRGEFAEQMDVIPQVKMEKIPVPKGEKQGKKPEVAKYTIISFDASVKRRVPQTGEHLSHRTSWIELDPEGVLYVERSILQTQRLLDPEKNPRWKAKRVVDVRAHQKKVPVKIHALRRVKASKQKILTSLSLFPWLCR